jgi:tRNA pseudouridine55 synthase
VSQPEGLLLIDKPAGITSHDVVDRVRRSLGTRKVGHAGTLDPMATGLMLVGVGRATRLLRYLTGLDKTYEGTARLGQTTDTLDADGVILARAPVDATREQVVATMASLTGNILQTPPAYSAVKVEGRKLYDAARKGETLEASPRAVTVGRFDLRAFDGTDFDFEVECSSGTYVRSLAADVGTALGCGAHLIRLRRTQVGPFLLSTAVASDADLAPLPLTEAVAALPSRNLSEAEAADVRHGRPLSASGLDGPCAVFDPTGVFLAVYRDEGDVAKAEMVLTPEGANDAG